MQGIWLIAFILQWAMLLLLAVLLAGVLRFLASFQEKMALAAPPISRFELGERTGDFALPDVHGQIVSGKTLFDRSQRTVLLIMSPSCIACQNLVLQIDELAHRPDGLDALRWPLVLVVTGKKDEIATLTKQHSSLLEERLTVLVDEESTIISQYGVRAVPVGIAVDKEGYVSDQSLNPHVDWLYKTTGVKPPARPVMHDQAIITPAIQLRH